MGHILVYLRFKNDCGPYSGLFAVQEGSWAIVGSICCLKGIVGHTLVYLLFERDCGPYSGLFAV